MLSSRKSSISLLFILLATVLLAIPFHLRPDNFIVDDGYFYPQIARYIAAGKGSTFNGVIPTNGYHPLWMLVCVIGAWITSASSPLIQLLSAVQDVLTLISLVLLVKITEAAGKRGAIAGCIPIVFLSMVLGIWRLLEANLALTMQICVLILAVPILPAMDRRLGTWRSAVLGLLLGLTLLSRLDLLFFVGVVLVYELFCPEPMLPLALRLKAVALQSSIVTAVVSPYLAWNLFQFHHLLPISGAIKSTFPHIQPWHIGLFVFPVIWSILLSGSMIFRRERTNYDVLCLLTAAGAALHLVYTLSFGGLAPWYLTTGYLNVSLCLIWAADRFLTSLPSLRWVEPAFGSVFFVFFLLLASMRLVSNFSYSRLTHGEFSFHGKYVEPKRALAERLQRTLPAGSRIFIFDAPGGVAFYSGMSIFPADGLVLDYVYNADLAREGFAEYAEKHRIDYFITPYLLPTRKYDRNYLRGERVAAGQAMHMEAPLTRAAAGAIVLRDDDLLFRFREINPDLEATLPQVGVWQMPWEIHNELPLARVSAAR